MHSSLALDMGWLATSRAIIVKNAQSQCVYPVHSSRCPSAVGYAHATTGNNNIGCF